MREIKFRIPLKNGYAYMDLLSIAIGEYEMSNWPWDEAEQFTGLTDKNGKEIYEGDVLSNGYTVVWDCIINCGCCNDDTGVGFVLGDSHMNYDELEVVGNIYENPELLD